MIVNEIWVSSFFESVSIWCNDTEDCVTQTSIHNLYFRFMGNIPENSFCPSSKLEWRDWFEKNHKKEEFVWLIFYKKKSPNYNLSWSEAVDEAICFGWIDSVKKTIDEERYIQYFSKRKPKSIWSKINKDKVERLSNEGLMTEAGLESIKVAKKNGSWTIYDAVEDLIVPEDLNDELKKNPIAKDYYESLSPSIRKGILYWVISAKRNDTRQKRIQEVIEKGSDQSLPSNFR